MNPDDERCSFCLDSQDAEECARQNVILPSVKEILKPITCDSCTERFPDASSLQEHVMVID